MTLPIILEMSPIAFGMESDLANTGITRVCREILIALDHLLAISGENQQQYYIYSSSSRWHNQLLAHGALHHLGLSCLKPLMDPCDITLASCIDAHSGFSLKGLAKIAEPWIHKLNSFGPTAKQFLSISDYVYLTSYLPTPGFVRTNTKAKIVHHVHDIFPLTRPSLFHGGIDDLWKRKAADFMPQDRYICISHATAADLRHVFPFIPDSHITVVPNAGDHALRIASGEPNAAVSKYGLEKSPFFITVSTLEPRKNLPFLLRGFREYKQRYQSDHKLVCIGASGWMADAERDFIESMSTFGDIHFLGRLSDPETFALIQQATAYISTARCEGFGLGLAEAMSLGCLPIAARNSSQIEVVDKVGMLFESINQLVESLQAAACTPCSKDKVQRLALQRFSWQRSASQLSNLLGGLAHNLAI